MIYFNDVNLAKWTAVTKKRINDPNIIEILREAAVEMYHDIIEETPQYSGYLVSNLRIGVNGVLPPVALDLYEQHMNWRQIREPKAKGDDYAIGVAAAYNRNFNTVPMKIDDTVTIRYLAPYWRVAESGTNLRDVNGEGRAMARAEARFKGKFRITWNQGYVPKGVFI